MIDIQKIKYAIILFFLSVSLASMGQAGNYSIDKVHSHNDYWQKKPFYLAYKHGLGSIEADTYLWKGKFLVAHDTASLQEKNSLQYLYLDPLNKELNKHKGYPYKDTAKNLQLLIELKSEPDEEISAIIPMLAAYPDIIHNPKVALVFTGNTPSEDVIVNCPPYIRFDGQLSKDYDAAILNHIAMLSDNLQDFISWDGTQPLTDAQKKVLFSWVQKGHGLGKKVRFWNAPDNPLAWKELMALGVDYINTDHIQSISAFFKHLK